MKLTLTGTGTSQGIPVIGCGCAVCTSPDLRNKRYRCAAVLQSKNTTIAIDAGPDLRMQLLNAGITNIDAVFLTHEHNDHIAGLDDLRPIIHRSGKSMPVYALPRVLEAVKARFAYAFGAEIYPGAPSFEMIPISENQKLQIGDIELHVLGVAHGPLPILGLRFGNTAYTTDVKTIPETTKLQIRAIEHWVVSALHHEAHWSHLNLSECLALITEMKVKNAYLIHQSHRMGLYEAVQKMLPQNVLSAYDQLVIAVEG